MPPAGSYAGAEDRAYDAVVIGSGFGGSVSALRLVEKGYRVLLLEKGGRKHPDDFPRTNWQLNRWLWLPRLGWRGIFRMTFLRHVTALSGVGVGGGSLVYANTLPRPKKGFFGAESWSHLAPWSSELEPHYRAASRMLGATGNPISAHPDDLLRELAQELGRAEHYELAQVGVFFGEPGKEVPDPYFGGEGPARTGCIACGACMIGCRHGAKNTLDLNYLYLAEKRGLRLEADAEVTWVRPLAQGGYLVEARHGTSALGFRNERRHYRADKVIFAGGVLGTVPLLLRLSAAEEGLPRLSARLGQHVRTNSEALLGVVASQSREEMCQGLAIGSILHTDEHSHVEPVRYPRGSGFFRLLALPHVAGDTTARRLAGALGEWLRHPLRHVRAALVRDWASRTIILLYMRSTEGQLRLELCGRSRRGAPSNALTSVLSSGPAPRAAMPEADDLARRLARRTGGVVQSLLTESLLGRPTTAHILGGCCMGRSEADGVIDSAHRLFGYEGLYVVDGSAVSANPGVNPSLTIAALAERAMSLIPPKGP